MTFITKLSLNLYNSYGLRHGPSEVGNQIKVGQSIYRINYDNYPLLKNRQVEQLMSTYNMNFSGLRSITRRDGFGSEFLIVLPPEHNDTSPEKAKYIVDPLIINYTNGRNPNIHNARYLAATITAQPRSASNIDEDLKHP